MITRLRERIPARVRSLLLWTIPTAIVLLTWIGFGFETVGLLLIIASFVGCVVFVVSYRPFDLRKHGRAGRHLLVMSWSLLGLFGVSLLNMFVPLPLGLMKTVSVVILSAITFAVWQRVALLRDVRYPQRPPVDAHRPL